MIRKHLLAGFMFASVAGSTGLQADSFLHNMNFAQHFSKHQNLEYAKKASALILIGGAMQVSKMLANSTEYKRGVDIRGFSGSRFLQNRGIDSNDFASAIEMSSAIMAFNVLTEKNTNYLDLGFRKPLAALVASSIFYVPYKEKIETIPVIGKYFSCSYQGSTCSGICKFCKIRKSILALGTFTLVDQALLLAKTYLKKWMNH